MQILQSFEEWVAQKDDLGCVVAYDGFAPDASVRHLLDNLCTMVRPKYCYCTSTCV